MMRKLRSEFDVYDTTAVVVAEWSDVAVGSEPEAEGFDGVRLRHDVVPADLAPDQFLASLVAAVLDRTPVEFHVEVRERAEHRQLPLTEGDDGADQADDAR